MEERTDKDEHPSPTAKGEWGHTPEDHFGYESDEERKARRGLEDWEMVESAPSAQRGVPKWFIAVIGFVLLIAIGLSFPFWGDRPGFERSWFNWGFVLALAYLLVAGSFVYGMVKFYGPPAKKKDDKQQQDDNHGDVSSNGPTQPGK
jgi:hypothetical protein